MKNTEYWIMDEKLEGVYLDSKSIGKSRVEEYFDSNMPSGSVLCETKPFLYSIDINFSLVLNPKYYTWKPRFMKISEFIKLNFLFLNLKIGLDLQQKFDKIIKRK